MSGLTLERARANHEDIEAYEAAIVAILEDKPRTVRYDHIRVYLLFPFLRDWPCATVFSTTSFPPCIASGEGTCLATTPGLKPDRADPGALQRLGRHLRGRARDHERGTGHFTGPRRVSIFLCARGSCQRVSPETPGRACQAPPARAGGSGAARVLFGRRGLWQIFGPAGVSHGVLRVAANP